MEKTDLLIGLHPDTFNYAVSLTLFDLDREKPMVRLVDYQELKWHVPNKRLPAGKFQTKDVFKAVDDFFIKNGPNKSLENFYSEVYLLDRTFMPQIDSCQKHSEINKLFNEFTASIKTKIQACKGISEEQYNAIIVETHYNTVRREAIEEAGSEKIGRIFGSSIKEDVHSRIGFVSADSKLPSVYKVTSDPKVLLSYWEEITDDLLEKNLFKGHKINLLEAINVALKLKIHPNVECLRKFFSSAS